MQGSNFGYFILFGRHLVLYTEHDFLVEKVEVVIVVSFKDKVL